MESIALTMVFSSLATYSSPSCTGPGKVHPGHESSTVWALFVHRASSRALAVSTSLATSRGTRKAEACKAKKAAARDERRIMAVV